MLTIWGGLKSNNVQKVIWTADELALAYTHIPAGMEHGVTDTPAYRKLNPNGLVPLIEDDGFILWESNVIVRYLGAKYGDDTFYPSDLQQRALADRWMDWSVLQFYAAMGPAFRQLVRTPADQHDEGQIKKSLSQAEKYVTILDQHLAGKPFANGAYFSMADICLGVIAHRWLGLPVKRQPRPHLERWFNLIRERKAAQRVLVLPLR
jgi:glutathione S-transferase